MAELGALPSDARLADMYGLNYLRAVVNESLRMYGAAPGSLLRLTPEGNAVLEGYSVPAGTIVSVQAYKVHRDGRIFASPEE